MSNQGVSGDGLVQFTGGIVGGTASAAYGVGKVVFEIGWAMSNMISESAEDDRRYARAKAVSTRLATSDSPIVEPWMGMDGGVKILGTLDLIASTIDGNAIILTMASQPGGPRYPFHLEPVSAHLRYLTRGQRLYLVKRECVCLGIRILTADGRIASCYGFITAIGSPSTLVCADSVHALLVDTLWVGKRIGYHIGSEYEINMSKRCDLGSPPTLQDLETHGLRVTRKSDPDAGAFPVMQSCWDCCHCVFYHGIHPLTGTKWCLHGDPELLPPHIIESMVGAIGGPFVVRFTTGKNKVTKKFKTYQLIASIGGPISLPPSPEKTSKFTASFQTTPVQPTAVKFMSRGAHPKSPADTRWEFIIRGEGCWHASVAPPTVVLDVAPRGSIFIKSLEDIPGVHREGLIPIAVGNNMDDAQRAALSLRVADTGGWIYQKSYNQCFECAASKAREINSRGGMVVVLS
jgi:hypothetical protein